MTGTENDGVLAFDDKPQSCRLWAINIELSVETTEFYHSWNRNIVPNSLESLEALTRLNASICLRLHYFLFVRELITKCKVSFFLGYNLSHL